MARVGETGAALRPSEGGFTLIELLVAITIGMVVLGGAVTVFIGAVRSGPRTSDKVTSIQQGRVAVERMTRELRQGVAVLDAPAPTASQIAFITYVKQSSCTGPSAPASIPCRVTYACTAGACSRQVADPDGSPSGAAVQILSGLATTNVFSYVPSTDPTYVGVELAFAQSEGGPVVVADGVALRNGDSS